MDKELALAAVRKFSELVRTILDPAMVVLYSYYVDSGEIVYRR